MELINFTTLQDHQRVAFAGTLFALAAADGEIDFAEDAHLRAVGAGLGLPPESFKELVVDILEEIDVEEVDHLRYGHTE